MLKTEDTFLLLDKALRMQLEKNDNLIPSKIQELAIPSILKGENVLLIAPTGTGKTFAATLPIFNLFLSSKKSEGASGISILYITPLRALNRDIFRRISEIGKELGIDVQVRHGDTVQSVRAKQAKKPPDMLITTPETIQAILPGKRMKEHLKSVKWVIVDEIHELVDSKRGIQLSLALERLRNIIGNKYQRIGLSATIGDETKIAKLLAGSDKSVRVLRTQEFKDIDIKLEYPLPSGDDFKIAKSFGIPPSSIARVKMIAELASKNMSILVFTNTREHAEALGSQIRAIRGDLPIRTHHGSLSREIREEVEEEFQAGKLKGIICTSSLELGVDVGVVDYVIQYMSPRGATRLIQRIGRSNHQVTGLPKGCVITCFPDDVLESFVLIKRAKQGKIDAVKIHEGAFDVLAHQIVGIVMDLKRVKIQQIYSIVREAYPYWNLSPEDLVKVINQLESEKILRKREDWISLSFRRTYQYYFGNLSVIPDVRKYHVLDFFRKARIGTLDQAFVAKKCATGVEFIMHGSTWRILSIDDEERKIEVEPTNPSFNAIPSWEGELIPVEHDVAQEVGGLRKILAASIKKGESISSLCKEAGLSSQSMDKVKETIQNHVKHYPLPSDDLILIERFENCVIIHGCFGNLVNEVYGAILRALIGAKYGIDVSVIIDPYRIALVCPIKINERIVGEELLKLTPIDLEEILIKTVQETENFAWINWHVAKRFGAVESEVEYKISRGKQLARILSDTPINQEAIRELFLEKMDLVNAKSVAKRIIDGKIKIEFAQSKEADYSPLALPILDKIVPHSVLRPISGDKSILEIIKERILSNRVRLVCIFNADWEGIRIVGKLPESIKCPKCGSTLISVTYKDNNNLFSVIRKKKNGKRLEIEETEMWNRAWKSAGLVQNNGKKAVIVLASRGVGPTVATRILRKYVRKDSDFYKEILKAEREYQRTRSFWD